METTTQNKLFAPDSFLIAAFLSFVGGFFDAYTYLCRGGVFSNAQTGNIVLLGINIMQLNFNKALHYLFPVLCFVVGIIIVELIKTFAKNRNSHRKAFMWRQNILVLEIIAVNIVGFLGTNSNTIANVIISLVCSIQVQGFRTVNGNPFATTMCTGNLRSGTEKLYDYFTTKQDKSLKAFFAYFGTIVIFIVGATVGAFVCNYYDLYAVLFCNIPLFIVFVLLFHC